MSSVIGVDLGSSSARAIAIDRTGAVLASAVSRYDHADAFPRGRASAQSWLTAVVQVVREVIAALGEDDVPIALSIGGQSPSVVSRGVELAVTVRHPAGATLSPREQHEAQAEVLAAEGGQEPAQGYDWIARQLGADHWQSRWVDDEEIGVAQGTVGAAGSFGQLARTGQAIGVTNGAHGIPAGLIIAAGGQDAFLAFWAGGLTQAGLAMDPGGRTGGFVAAVDIDHLAADEFSIASANSDVAIVGGPVSGHGLAIEWLRDLTGQSVESLLDAASAVPAGAGGSVFVPYLEGERAPRWNRDLRAGLSGVQSATGPAELTRAVLEGTAYGLRHVLDGVRTAGVHPTAMICTGSPSQSLLWCTIKASILEMPVLIPVEPNLAALGSAFAAAAAAGWWPAPGQTDRADAWPVPEMTRVDPEPFAAYAAGYQQFLELGDFAERVATAPIPTVRSL